MRHDDPKENILRAATKVFAARGFRDATVREICAAADVNVAMVNYHFKSKAGLYAEVVRRIFAFTTTDELLRLPDDVRDAESWRRAIRRFVEVFADQMTGAAKPGSYATRLFRWEATRPSSICRELQETYGSRVYYVLKRLLAMALGDDAVALKLWCGTIWSRLATLAVVDEQWLRHFIPKGFRRDEWVSRIVDNQCDIIFAMLTYRGDRGTSRNAPREHPGRLSD